MGSFKAAVVQMRSGREPAENIDMMRSLVAGAAAEGAIYVQTPEMTGVLEKNRNALFGKLEMEEHDVVAKAASLLAAEHGIYLHLGSTAVKLRSGRLANRAFLFGPDGSEVARYDKIHMFDVDLDNGESWRESALYQAGNAAVIARLPFAAFGIAICYDIRFPQLFREQALQGAEVLTAPAAFTRQTGQAHWHVLQRARAIENGAWVISAAQGGKHEDGRETYGHSLIVDPWGAIIAEIDGEEPGFSVADIDIGKSVLARKKIPNLINSREFCVRDVALVENVKRKAS